MRKFLFFIFILIVFNLVGCSKPKFSISFNSNGGSTVNSITQDYNTTITKPSNPTKEGYTFAGWYSDEALYTGYKFITMPAKDITLYAKWELSPLDFYLLDNGEEYGVKIKDSVKEYIQTLTIDSEYNNKPVTAILKYGFEDCINLTSILIPESVITIDFGAFWNCSLLTSITIPEGVTSIAFGSFWNCSSLTSISIPESVTSIDSAAFYNCSSLTSIIIPESVSFIGSSAFSGCESLTSITIPKNVERISNSVFSGCSSLTSIIIPESVTSIGIYAFYNCTSLTSIIIPDSVTRIDVGAFYDCPSLKIFCEAESQPDTWSNKWNSSNRPVVWGYVTE